MDQKWIIMEQMWFKMNHKRPTNDKKWIKIDLKCIKMDRQNVRHKKL